MENHVLLLESNPVLRFMMKTVVEGRLPSARVMEADTPNSAWKQAEGQPVNWAVVDSRFASVAPELIRRLRQQQPEARIALLGDTREAATALGMDWIPTPPTDTHVRRFLQSPFPATVH